MTKLAEWLTAAAVIISIWIALLTGKLGGKFAAEHDQLVLFMPVILVGLFGIYAITVVLYRTFTFNTCEDAAVELQKEIKAAREDLTKQGFAFKSNNQKTNEELSN